VNDEGLSQNSSDVLSENSLTRFKIAQDLVYHRVVAELEQGYKQSHWIWFIFPQFSGLAKSATAKKYAIKNKTEAMDYLQDPLLVGRLNQCCELLLKLENKSAREILGIPDDLKLASSMTLFARVSGKDSIYQKVLDKYYDGQYDQMTINFLK
jgi:uncharacterized protein (DUF1810 family)